MNNSCMTSISLRTRGTFSFSIYDYPHCTVERSPFAYASPTTCCCCCANSWYRVPVSSSYCYNLYGLRQSSLIQLSHCRKFVSRGADRYYARLPISDVDGSCYCDDGYSPRKISEGGRKGGLRKCMVFEERSETCDTGDVDEAEILLNLLTEDVSEECLLAARETRRLVKKPEVEWRGNGGKRRSKKKTDDVGVLESENRYGYESVVSSRKKSNRREQEVVQREEEKGGALRRESKKAALRSELADGSLAKRAVRREEERLALLRKASQEDKVKREREPKLQEENWKVASRTEEREDLMSREEHGQKVRKEGSSCSSYYSFSSGGDYESDKDIELREGRYLGESSSSHMKSSKSNEIVYLHAREEEKRRHEDYGEDHGDTLTNESSKNKCLAESKVCESDFRKKSEKKLVDVSVQEMQVRKEALQKESKHTLVHKGNYGKSSDYHVSYDDRLAKSTGSTKFDVNRKQQYDQTGNEVPRQTETRFKYKQFGEMQESLGEDVIRAYGSQKIYSDKGEMPAKVATLSQETVGEHRRAAGHSTREDELQRSSIRVAKVSEDQDVDTRKISVTQQRFETGVKEEDHSTNISISDATKQTQHDQLSGQVESTGKTQLLTKKEGKSILKKVSDRRIKQEETLNLVYGSSSESKIIKSDDSKKRYDEWTKTSFTHSGDSGAIGKEGKRETESFTQVEIPSNLQETGASYQRSNVESATSEVSEGSLQSGSTPLHGRKLARSPALHHEAYVEEDSNSAHGQPSGLISEEDAIRSVAQFEKFSTQYVSEYFGQVRNEFSSSEERTNETKVVQEGQQHLQNLVQHSSGDSQSKKHDLRSDGQQSGTKGPSDEMWKVDEPSRRESSRTEVSDDASKAGKDMDKRTGRSLWSRISDIVLLRWSSHSESHGSDRKGGGRSSPNQTTSSDTWFSGHEAAENQEVTEEKEHKSTTQGLSGSNQEEKNRSQEDGSSSSTLEDNRTHVGINAPSSSDAQELQPTSSSLYSGVLSEGVSTEAMAESSIHLPAFQLQRSPAVQGVSEPGKVNESGIGTREKLNTGSIVQTESAVDEGELKRRKFQRQDQVIKDRFDEWESAYKLETEQRKIDEMFMREALLEAKNAADNWEVPVGAVLVHDGKIIARGFNLVEELRDSTAHAEIICIREASNLLRTWRLSETTLYVTLEPCPMCAGAILQARVDTVVWGAPNKLLGADGSWIRLFPNGDEGNGLELTDKPAAPVHPFHPKIVIRRGVLQSECADAMQQFFTLRRKKDKKPDSPSSSFPPSCLPVSHRPSKLMAKMHDAFAPRFFC